jgi:hypothetical protein
MCAAAAEMMAQCFQQLVVRRVRGTQQQRLGSDDHAVETVAALRSLFADEGLLHGVGMLARAETFKRHDVAPRAALDRDHAGARRDAVEQHRAGAAFAKTAAIFWSVQGEVVAQHIEQCSVGRGADIASFAIDGQAHRALRHAPLSLRCAANYALDASGRYRLCTNVQAARSRAAARARFMNRATRQMRYYAASRAFRGRGRLTAFPSARNIIRIRTKCRAARKRLRSAPSRPQACS